MAKMTKGTFNSKNGKGKMESRNGYLFELALTDGKVKDMGVYNADDGRWYVVDLESGRSLCDSNTRKNAVEIAESETVVRKFTELVNSDKYRELVEPTAKPKAKPKAAPKATTAKTKVPKAPAKPKDAKAPAKVTVKQGESELIDALMRLKKLEQEIADLKAGKLTAEQEAIARKITEKATAKMNAAASEWTVETVREWATSRGFVAEQVNPERRDCIWVYGVRKDDKATQKELVGMGFRWGKKGWYIDPKRARK